MNRKLFLLVIVLLAAVVLPARWAAAFRTIDGATHLLLPGLSARGYLSDDDMARIPSGRAAGDDSPANQVDPASLFRLQARVDMWPNDLVDDSCDDPVIEFEVRNWSRRQRFLCNPARGCSTSTHPII